MPQVLGISDTDTLPFSYMPAPKRASYSIENYQFSPEELLTPGGEVSRPALFLQAVMAYAAYAQSTAQLAGIASVLGCRSYHLFEAALPTPNTALFSWAQGNVYCVAGTTSWSQVLNFLLSTDNVEPPAPRMGLVYRPMSEAALAVNRVLSADYNLTGPGARVAFLGHSLGGAVAYLVGQFFQQGFSWPVVRAVTFGAPRYGNAAYANIGSPRLVRVINEGDPITLLLPKYGLGYDAHASEARNRNVLMSYVHPRGGRWQVHADGSMPTTWEDEDGADNVFRGAWDAGALSAFAGPHRMAEYVYRSQVRLQRVYTLDPARQPFLRSLYDQYVILHNAIGDGWRVLPPG